MPALAPATPTRAPATRTPEAMATRPSGGARPGGGAPSGPSTVRSSTLLPLQGAPTAIPQVSVKVAPGELDLSKGPLAIPADVVESLKDGGELDVKVRLPGLAQGELKLRRRGEHFSSTREQGILLTHPALARFSAATPTVLVLRVADEVVTGWVGLGTPGPAKGGKGSLFEAMTKASDVLGWAGLSGIRIPTFHNKFADGVIDVRAEKLAFTVGGFLKGTASAALDNKALSFDGSAQIKIPGGNTGELQIRKDPAGVLAGKLDLAVNIGSVAGNVTATLTGGFVSILGSVAYNGDRMSGKVTLVATDEATARDITLKKPEAGAEVPIELPGPDKPVKPGKRAFCGWGQLTFRVTDWLAGTATVIINSKGQATVIGEIAPPKEFLLFDEIPWKQRIFKLEIRAGYGIPVVGQVAIFANIALDAIAKVGPGKLYRIKLTGAYSTDPRVTKQLTIEGTINISAFAGLRLRAEAGLVVTIISHDIKAGVGLNALAGVRGYVEAIPRIGMRELQPGKRQYFIQGHLEIAAQPVLGFSGDLFVELETPWWSPLSDKRWTWPLFSIEYPLPGEFGIGADVDYVLGSKQWPKVEFGEVDFDSSKFLTDVMNDNADSGRGGEKKKQGDWKEGLGGGAPGGAKNKRGTGKGKAGEQGEDIGPIGEDMRFSDGRESHRLWIDEKGADTTTMLASDGGKIESTLGKWNEKSAIVLPADASQAKTLLAVARQQAERLGELADKLGKRKQAAKNAREFHKRYGKLVGGKKEKGKKDLKKAQAEVRRAQRALEATVEQLAKILVTMPFAPLARAAPMHNGTVKVEIVAHKIAPAIRIQGAELSVLFPRLLGGPIGRAINKAAERLVQKAWADLGDTGRIGKEVRKVRIRNGEVNVRAYQLLLQNLGPIAALITGIGRPMRVPNLEPRARQSLPLLPPTFVHFPAYPKSPGKKLFSAQFITELKRQLAIQQRYLNQLRVDEWFVNLAKFKMDRDVYLQLDASARKTVRQEYDQQAASAKDRTAETVAREQRRLDRVLIALAQHGVRDTVVVSESGKPDRVIELSYGLRGDIISQLVRAQKRAPAVRVALDELRRAQREDEMPELIRSRYPGLKEVMKLRIGGRTGGEKAARAHYEQDLPALLKKTTEWESLATEASDLAMAHRGDMVAGGYDRFPLFPRPPGKVDDSSEWKRYLARLREFVGPSDVNSKIGSDWSRLVGDVKKNVARQVPTHEAQPLNRINLRLIVQGSA
jgi:hypothetical protein